MDPKIKEKRKGRRKEEGGRRKEKREKRKDYFLLIIFIFLLFLCIRFLSDFYLFFSIFFSSIYVICKQTCRSTRIPGSKSVMTRIRLHRVAQSL